MKPVSVIVCAYNAENEIAETLDSLICQTYREIEILIIDDASTDRTAEICHTYAEEDARIRIVTHLENRGLAHGRKTGVDEARHEFITFIDADDVAMPNMVERLVQKIENDSRILGVSAYRIYFDDVGDLGIQRIGPTTREEYMYLYENNKLVFLSYPNLVRKSDVLAVGGYRVDISIGNDGIRYADFCEDLDTWCRMSDLSADGRYFITLKEPLSKYRKPLTSMSTGNVRLMQHKIRWIKDCLKRRRTGQEERRFQDFVLSRSLIERVDDWRADKAAIYYKRAGFSYAKRSFMSLAWFLLLSGVFSPKLLFQKVATQRVTR